MPSKAVPSKLEYGEHAYVLLINPLRKGKTSHSVSMWCTYADSDKFHYMPMQASPPQVSKSVVCVASNSLKVANHIRQHLIGAWELDPSRVLHCPWVAPAREERRVAIGYQRESPEAVDKRHEVFDRILEAGSPIPQVFGDSESDSELSFDQANRYYIQSDSDNEQDGADGPGVVLRVPMIGQSNYTGLYERRGDEYVFEGNILSVADGAWQLSDTSFRVPKRIMTGLPEGPGKELVWRIGNKRAPRSEVTMVSVHEHLYHTRYAALLTPVITLYSENKFQWNKAGSKYGGIFVFYPSKERQSMWPRYKKPGREHYLSYGDDGYWYIDQYEDAKIDAAVWRIQSNALTAGQLPLGSGLWEYNDTGEWKTSRDMQVYDSSKSAFTPYEENGILDTLVRVFGLQPAVPALPVPVKTITLEDGTGVDLSTQTLSYGRTFAEYEIQALESVVRLYLEATDRQMRGLTLFSKTEAVRNLAVNYTEDYRARMEHFEKQTFPFVFLVRNPPGGASMRRTTATAPYGGFKPRTPKFASAPPPTPLPRIETDKQRLRNAIKVSENAAAVTLLKILTPGGKTGTAAQKPIFLRALNNYIQDSGATAAYGSKTEAIKFIFRSADTYPLLVKLVNWFISDAPYNTRVEVKGKEKFQVAAAEAARLIERDGEPLSPAQSLSDGVVDL